MTRKEAIKRIKEHMQMHYSEESRAVYITEALLMAIEALEHEERMDKLKTCPFCGSDALVGPFLYSHGFASEEKILYQISCGAQ